MQNPRLAARYAKSLMDLALELGKTEDMYRDIQSIHEICQSSHDFVMMMRSPVIKAEKKLAAVKAIFQNSLDRVTDSFLTLIIKKGREFFIPEMATAFMTQYKLHNKINDVVLTTAEPISEDMKGLIENKIKQQFQNMTIDLKTEINPEIVGGFILEVNNTLFDASILRDLLDIKKQFLKNVYVPDIR
ncbi:MAG: ATP synthase F1 subunit delta [Chitinophagaceae bacterium]|nr:ATP synthase F1 subunit delta [Chitinophagaceae bacterium]